MRWQDHGLDQEAVTSDRTLKQVLEFSESFTFLLSSFNLRRSLKNHIKIDCGWIADDFNVVEASAEDEIKRRRG
ncbi:hypothetical protein QN277_019369 [Acacia crassicarpa]|uniref:Uncharacterized protein n=1 Tax=Acacia crassicarpa TaxID=499986 RepID=A0AAE1JVJ8_9FABA|nr:hypothetical protein QN277_019369 [Acacia crassicarpa]